MKTQLLTWMLAASLCMAGLPTCVLAGPRNPGPRFVPAAEELNEREQVDYARLSAELPADLRYKTAGDAQTTALIVLAVVGGVLVAVAIIVVLSNADSVSVHVNN